VTTLTLVVSERTEADDAFIAGAPGFVIACAAAVQAAGLCLAHIHTEPFFADPGS
jgi:hypothetical protein